VRKIPSRRARRQATTRIERFEFEEEDGGDALSARPSEAVALNPQSKRLRYSWQKARELQGCIGGARRCNPHRLRNWLVLKLESQSLRRLWRTAQARRGDAPCRTSVISVRYGRVSTSQPAGDKATAQTVLRT